MKQAWYYKLFYGIGNLGYSVVSQTITNFFMFFGTSVLKIPGALVGVAIAISTLWDGLTDPVIGFVSDNYPIKGFGNRNGYMLIATFGIAVINLFIWCVPQNISVAAKFVWVVISLILIETFNTMFNTPYSALSSDIVTDYNDRTQIQIYKTIFFLVGMILPSVLLNTFLPSTPEYPQGQLNPGGYVSIAIFCSAIMFVCGVLCVFGTLRFLNVDAKKTNNKLNLKNIFLGFCECLKNEHLKIIIFGNALSLISAAILTSVGMHFFTYCFKYSTFKITCVLSCLLLGMVVSQPFWYRYSIKEDKKPALMSGLITAIIGVIVVMLIFLFKQNLGDFSFYLMIVSMLIIGFGSGALYCLPGSMFMDVVSINDINNTKSATYSGFLTLSSNIANSAALFVVGILLDVIKFNPSSVEQNRIVQTGIAIILFVGVIISLIGSLFVFSRYKIKEKHLKDATNK